MVHKRMFVAEAVLSGFLRKTDAACRANERFGCGSLRYTNQYTTRLIDLSEFRHLRIVC